MFLDWNTSVQMRKESSWAKIIWVTALIMKILRERNGLYLRAASEKRLCNTAVATLWGRVSTDHTFIYIPDESPKAKAITSKLLKMIAVDLQPFSNVEDQRFQEFVKEMESQYVLPSRRSLLRTDLPHLFQKAQEDVEYFLAELNVNSLWRQMYGPQEQVRPTCL